MEELDGEVSENDENLGTALQPTSCFELRITITLHLYCAHYMWNMFMGALQELYNWNRHEQTEVDRKLTMAPLAATI